VISDPANEILLSVASLWEAAIKFSVGKLELQPSFEVAVLGQMARNDVRLLGIEVAHVTRTLTLPFHHRDPFDRLLVAQALEENLPVVSADAILDAYTVRRLW
jgi:PIN domain nuclease of toxin-antitoxin system